MQPTPVVSTEAERSSPSQSEGPKQSKKMESELPEYRESHLRSFLKALSWRVVATTTTAIIAWFITGDISTAIAIGSIEFVAKFFIYYGHERAWQDGNGHSHLQATLLGPSLSIPVTQGQMALGTWQQVFHLECDVRPRQREVVVTVMGE